MAQVLAFAALMFSSCTSAVTNAQLFAYAQATYPSLFAGAPAAGQYQQYDYRYYPDTQNFLAVDTAGVIHVLGPVSGGVILAIGPVSDFAQAITAWEAATTAYPLSAAVSGYLRLAHDHKLSASSGTNAYTLTWHSEPGSSAVFEGHASSTMNYANVVEMNGTAIAGASLTDYFDLAPFKPIGGVNRTLGSYEVASGQQLLPTTALIGQSGVLNSATRYSDASKRTPIATTTTNWSLEAAGAGLAWACLNVSISYVSSGIPPGAEAVCYRIDAAGNVNGVRMSLLLNGQHLIFE